MASELSITGKQFFALSKGVVMLMGKKKNHYVPWQLQQSPRQSSVVEFKEGVNVFKVSLKLIFFQIRLLFTCKQPQFSPVTPF